MGFSIIKLGLVDIRDIGYEISLHFYGMDDYVIRFELVIGGFSYVVSVDSSRGVKWLLYFLESLSEVFGYDYDLGDGDLWDVVSFFRGLVESEGFRGLYDRDGLDVFCRIRGRNVWFTVSGRRGDLGGVNGSLFSLVVDWVSYFDRRVDLMSGYLLDSGSCRYLVIYSFDGSGGHSELFELSIKTMSYVILSVSGKDISGDIFRCGYDFVDRYLFSGGGVVEVCGKMYSDGFVVYELDVGDGLLSEFFRWFSSDDIEGVFYSFWGNLGGGFGDNSGYSFSGSFSDSFDIDRYVRGDNFMVRLFVLFVIRLYLCFGYGV